MALQTLKEGSKGPAVLKWETFLRGLELLNDREVDEEFNAITKEATWQFQARYGLHVDGEAGPETIDYATRQLGFEAKPPKASDDFPPKPRNLSPVAPDSRDNLFGKIAFVAAPAKANPEGVKITNDWAGQNLGKVVIPQIQGVRGAPSSGTIFFHKKAIHQLQSMFQAWEAAGLSKLILTWGGSWAPRFIRGSRTVLSNHSWATAFDINVPWNGLNRTPALVGEQGSVRELVQIANQHGFYWGGHFQRRDGMHFEVCKLL